MRTRNQAKLHNQSSANEDSVKLHGEMESPSGCKDRASDNETLANISRDAVGKLLKRVNKSRGSRGLNTDDSYLCKHDSTSKPETGSREKEKQPTGTTLARTTLDANCCTSDALQNVPSVVENGGADVQYHSIEREDELDDFDWEDGSVHTLKSKSSVEEDIIHGVTVEFDAPPDPSKQKTVRRATAEEKELAELVHKVNLLCLLARGRLVDSACNDPLIQASLLSLLPAHLLKLTDVPKLTTKALDPLVRWFHSHFRVRGASDTEKSFHSSLASTLQSQEGTPEEVAALSVALFRALNLTTRYCTKWYKIASERVNSVWWDEVLAPLKELESVATSDVVHLRRQTFDESKKKKVAQGANDSKQDLLLDMHKCSENIYAESSTRNSYTATRSSLEDMELETRALTEPLPTNQQAYRSHHLYIIERWLNKCQILYPKEPVLGFCSGHPVYPRSCVQTLKRKERWLREGLQVKANEIPAKLLKRSGKQNKGQDVEDDDYGEGDCGGTVALYGQWQTEPLCLPPAVNGIVPKNERGQVDVWSEKCLPPGTVHLRLPRLVPVAKRLEIDFAPAMVGFEFRNGRSLPLYEGIVVCTEFKDAILEAYAEEEERREAKERKRSEAEALSRWYQLLASLITRQRLHNCYVEGASSQPPVNVATSNVKSSLLAGASQETKTASENQQEKPEIAKSNRPPIALAENHEHVFLVEDQTIDDENSTRTKRCRCGFSVQYEEL